MAELPKRPNYFSSQFLVVRDFQDEQAYHEEMLRRHNLYLHEWGVVRDGLQVSSSGDNRNLSISPGTAIDSLGREIVLEAAQPLSLDKARDAVRESGSVQDFFITIVFDETGSDKPEDKYPPPGGTENVTRMMQSPKIKAVTSPAKGSAALTLARVSVAANGDVGQPDNSVRKLASSLIARGSNLGEISLDGALSFTSKSSPNPTYPQVGLDYDAASDALRIRARTKDAPALDTAHVTIKRETGNVGIGTSDPAAKLHVGSGAIQVGTVGDFVTLIDGSITHWFQKEENPRYTINRDLLASGWAGIGFAPWKDSINAGGAAVGIPASRALGFYTSDGSGLTERVRIDSSGKVGIGTTEPATRLTIKAARSTIPAPTPPPTVSSFIQAGSTIVRAYSNSTFEQIKVGDVISSVISSDQRTVIRKISETEILIDRPFNFSGAGVTLTVITKPPPVSEDMFRVEDSAGDTKFFIAGDGNVGIGTDRPTALLTLRGSAELGSPVEGINSLEENQLNGWGAEQPPDGTLLIIVGFDSISKTHKTLFKKVDWSNFISPGHVDNTILLESTDDDSSSIRQPAVYFAPPDTLPLLAVHNYVGEKVLGITASEVSITKNLNKPGGAFKIDHPLDPANKYLYHSFVESPDMKNIYDGVAVLDSRGEAWVELPEWFEALNRDFRYQLTALNASAPNIYIAQEIRDGCFKIAGGVARMKVCWQVTGIRQDAYANANRIEVEAEKPVTERGRYLHPEAFGQPPGKAIGSTDSNGRGSSSSH